MGGLLRDLMALADLTGDGDGNGSGGLIEDLLDLADLAGPAQPRRPAPGASQFGQAAKQCENGGVVCPLLVA